MEEGQAQRGEKVTVADSLWECPVDLSLEDQADSIDNMSNPNYQEMLPCLPEGPWEYGRL